MTAGIFLLAVILPSAQMLEERTAICSDQDRRMTLAQMGPADAPRRTDLEGRLEESAKWLPDCLGRFVGYHSTAPRGKFVPNPKFYLSGIDFTCVSPWNSGGGSLRAGTAISRRHIIFAKHFPVWKGVRMAFVGHGGAVTHYTVTRTMECSDCDIMIGALDAELTSDIRPAQILPKGFEAHLPDGSTWPVVTFNQHEEAFLSEINCRSNRQNGVVSLLNCAARGAQRKAFGGRIIVGDSGDPAFLLYKGHPILVYCLHTGGVGHGPQIHEKRAEVQHIMDELAPGYRLTCFDFNRVSEL